jgi:signal transduction histidine kinase
MGFVTILWSLAAGVSLTLAVVTGSVGLAERRDTASLTLCLLGVSVAACAYLELWMMKSATPAEYGEWLRWYHVPFFFALLAQILFIHYYLGTSRSWLMWTVVVMRLAVLVGNFAVHPNFNFSGIAELHHMRFLGEEISSIGLATTRPGSQSFSLASHVLMIAYIVDAAIGRWRLGGRDSRRKAVVITLCIVIPWLGTLVPGQLIMFGATRGPITNLPWFLGALFVMMFEMTRDYVVGRGALVDSAELQRQLLQIERVSVLDQLASSLAHQLAQPLSASAMNSVVALKHLEDEKPDREELRAILTDINTDSRRGAELISRMRELVKNHAIEMRPVRMEDVVQDAVSLIRPEAIAKRVTLSLLMQQNLPRVMGDRLHLSQVLINLLMNSIYAVQSRLPEARRVVVEARADEASGRVELTVRDSGPGIPDGIVDKVFGPFFTTKPEGMGMGLALSRTIIEAHGGLLWMDRTNPLPQEGAVFRFTLQQA